MIYGSPLPVVTGIFYYTTFVPVNYDYIIVGQGIAGTMLSWFLQKAGQQVLVYDDALPNSASRVAAGIINPVSGRKFETAWLYDTIFPFAENTYHEMEAALGISCFHERLIHHVWPSAQMKNAFEEAMKTNPYLVEPAFVKGANIQLNALLPAWRKRLQVKEEHFDASKINITVTGINYKGIEAKAVIFCEGAQSPANPYWKKLKFLPNKGEALIIKAPGLKTRNIIKRGNLTIVPMEEEDLYWAGATFSWDYTDALPSQEARASIESALESIPHEVMDHIAAIRPSGPDRRPLVGMHPHQPHIGIFNGMGSKGCSLAPWAADQFVKHLLEAAPLQQEIDIKRYFNALR